MNTHPVSPRGSFLVAIAAFISMVSAVEICGTATAQGAVPTVALPAPAPPPTPAPPATSSPPPATDVAVEEIRDNGLAARFYTPFDRSPRTTVVMLAGSGGGFPEDVSARDLARSGFSVLALAYVRNWQGEPAELSRTRILEVPLEYIFSAIDWLKTRNEVRPNAIALMGESRGAELALLVASYRPDVAGVVAFSPTGLRWGAVFGGGPAWTLNGAALPYVQGTWNPTDPHREWTDVLDGPPEAVAKAWIEVERIRGPILLVSSKADGVYPSPRMSDDIERRLKERQFPYRLENLQFDDASHLLMGFGPGMTESRSGQTVMRFGGTASGTEAARNAGWARAKQFLAAL